MGEITLIVAFVAGIVSFLSPCVLPIIPGFLAYLAGTSLNDKGKSDRLRIFMNSVFFVLGFSVVFAVLGVLLNTLLERVAYDALVWLSRVGGLIIIFFGLYLAGILKIPFLEREHKISVKRTFGSRYTTSFVFGAAFAAGWTPCVGAALGAILGLAATEPGAAFYLLLSYALGLGLPFLAVGAFASRADRLIARLGGAMKWLNVIFGIVLVALGVLVFTQSLNLIANFSLLNNFLLR
jgi:cytochrome c-type biogenesis protein